MHSQYNKRYAQQLKEDLPDKPSLAEAVGWCIKVGWFLLSRYIKED